MHAPCRNYGPTIYVQQKAARDHGAQQVLWLYGPDHLVTEVGTMNIFMLWKNARGGKQSRVVFHSLLSRGRIWLRFSPFLLGVDFGSGFEIHFELLNVCFTWSNLQL